MTVVTFWPSNWSVRDRRAVSERGIVRTYLAVTTLTTLAQSLIWGVNTLFLMHAGLDILV